MSEEYFSRRAVRVALVILPLILLPFFSVGGNQGTTIVASINCPPKQFVIIIQASNDQCGFAEAQLVEQGNTTVLISTAQILNFTIINFPFPFPRTPNVTATMVSDAGIAVEYHIHQTQYFVVSSNSTSTYTWNKMPSALTELFGTTTHRQWFMGASGGTLSCTVGSQATCGGLTVVDLWADIAVAGSANSVLRVQYNNSTMPNIATGWADPCNGTADLPISSTGLQSGAICGGCSTCSQPFQAAQIRVVGVNGNGVASPGFGIIGLDLDFVVARYSTLSICGNFCNLVPLCPGGICSVTPTSALVTVFTFPVAPIGGLTYVITWHAYECILANLSAC